MGFASGQALFAPTFSGVVSAALDRECCSGVPRALRCSRWSTSSSSSTCSYSLASICARSGCGFRSQRWRSCCSVSSGTRTPEMIEDFLGGAIAMGFATAAVFFLKFWQRTREGLFLAFAGSFLLLGVTQALLTLGAVTVEERSWLYTLRL